MTNVLNNIIVALATSVVLVLFWPFLLSVVWVNKNTKFDGEVVSDFIPFLGVLLLGIGAQGAYWGTVVMVLLA